MQRKRAIGVCDEAASLQEVFRHRLGRLADMQGLRIVRLARKIMAQARRKKPNLKKYDQSSVRKRIEAFFLDNIGKTVSRVEIQEVARDPGTGKVPENWHQRLSELRTDSGYTILSWRDRSDLKVSEYLMPRKERRPNARVRVRVSQPTWSAILLRAKDRCEWNESGEKCGLKNGECDPVGGGTVRLTPDHRTPHSLNPKSDPNDVSVWQALCGRHQVVKKNYWDNVSGKLNAYSIVQAAPARVKREIFEFLREYFAE